MEDLEKLMEALSQEALRQVKEVSRQKTVTDRRTQAETVHLLCQSLGSLIDSTSMAAAEMCDHFDDYEYDEDEDDLS